MSADDFPDDVMRAGYQAQADALAPVVSNTVVVGDTPHPQLTADDPLQPKVATSGDRRELRALAKELSDKIRKDIGEGWRTDEWDEWAEMALQKVFDLGAAHQREQDAQIVEVFVGRVNARTEADMLAGRPITGAHHRALAAEVAALRRRSTPGAQT